MSRDRGITIFFLDGSKMSFSFPQQVDNADFVPMRMDRALEKDLLFIEADGAVLAFPFANIKYFQVYPAPSKLPEYVIKNASISG